MLAGQLYPVKYPRGKSSGKTWLRVLNEIQYVALHNAFEMTKVFVDTRSLIIFARGGASFVWN